MFREGGNGRWGALYLAETTLVTFLLELLIPTVGPCLDQCKSLGDH